MGYDLAAIAQVVRTAVATSPPPTRLVWVALSPLSCETTRAGHPSAVVIARPLAGPRPREPQHAVTIPSWLTRTAEDHCSEAARHPDQETGGVLLGYFSPEGCESWETPQVLVRARSRSLRQFHPDIAWQRQEVAVNTPSSGRINTYLGDWHTDPNGVLVLSPTDRRTLRRISQTATAVCRKRSWRSLRRTQQAASTYGSTEAACGLLAGCTGRRCGRPRVAAQPQALDPGGPMTSAELHSASVDNGTPRTCDGACTTAGRKASVAGTL